MGQQIETELAKDVHPGEELGIVADAQILPDRRVLVLDQQQASVLVFDAAGRLSGTIGQRGKGPGEFASPIGIEVSSDSLFVVDPSNQRISVFSIDGDLIAERPARVPFVIGDAKRRADGHWVVRRGNRFSLPYDRHGIDGLARDTLDYFVLDEELHDPVRVTTVPGIWGAQVVMEGLHGGRPGHRTAPYSPRPLSDTWGLCFYRMTTDRPEVEVYGPVNDLIHVESFPAVAQETDTEARELFLRRTVSFYPTEEERALWLQRGRRAMPFPAHLPVSQGLIVDDLGYVWIHAFEPDGMASDYFILSPDLHYLGRLRLPVEFYRLLDVDVDSVVGLVVGPNDEHIVTVLRLQRGRPEVRPPPQCGPA